MSTEMKQLKKFFGGFGYYIFPLSKTFRFNRQDFVAIPKDRPLLLVTVHLRNKKVIVRPYCSEGSYYQLDKLLKEIREKHSLPVSMGSQIRLKRNPPKVRHLLSPNSRRELDAYFPKLQVAN